MSTKKDHETILKIAKRAAALHIEVGDRMTMILDIDAATNKFNLRLNDLLDADDFNFCHDICGIQANINRRTGEIENCFVPRYAG